MHFHPNFLHQQLKCPRMCLSKSPSFLKLPYMPPNNRRIIQLLHPATLNQPASVSSPLIHLGQLHACVSLLWGLLTHPSTHTQIRQHCVGLWSLGPDMWKQSQQWKMKWYIELIQRWISNDQDLISNPNIFTQHKQWLHRCMSESWGRGQQGPQSCVLDVKAPVWNICQNCSQKL